ncbi:DUF58 domain-containing protein [Desulfobacula sp.]|uniref:DUF58 domain-containing protein n=1 Tax=Desulfobacula sp. TaxID=2593537 RepID=UPI002631BB0F|nr:DUF58 domain-containing protein [Desulfobacula sp.]
MDPDQGVPFHVTTIFTSRLILMMALVFLFISLLNHQNQMTLLILLILGLICITKLWSRFAFSKMTFTSILDKHKIFPGERITLDITAENAKLLPVWLQVKVRINPSHFVSDTPLCENSYLLWFQRTRFSWTLQSLKRGCYPIGNPHITIADLLGFFPKQTSHSDRVEVIVYPEIISIRPVSLPQHIFFGVPGAQSPVQDPVYILGTREYQSFTPVKFIHWKASARYAKLQEKVCEPSVQEKILIVVDVGLFFTHQATSDFEQMLSAAASMAVNFENRGNAVGFMTNAVISGGASGFVPLGRNRQTLSRILETIARMQMKQDSRVSDIFHQHISVLWGISCIFCSHSIDSSLVKMKQFYARKRIPVKYFVSTMGEPESNPTIVSDMIQPIDTICL